MAEHNTNQKDVRVSLLWAVAILVIGVTSILGYVIVNGNMGGGQQFVAVLTVAILVVVVSLGSVYYITTGAGASQKKSTDKE